MAWAWKRRSEAGVWFGFALPSVTKETERALETTRHGM